MSTPDRMLTLRLKKARGLMRELIDLADMQGWSYRAKNSDEGMLFFPSNPRPGFDQIYARDPGSDNALAKQIKDRFRKAGMKFPEDTPAERKPKPMVTTQPKQPENQFDLVRQKINQTVNLLSEIEQAMKKIETDAARYRVIGEALKSLQGLG